MASEIIARGEYAVACNRNQSGPTLYVRATYANGSNYTRNIDEAKRWKTSGGAKAWIERRTATDYVMVAVRGK